MKSVVISFILCIVAAIIKRSSTQQSTLQSGAEGLSNTGAAATPHRPGGLFSRGLFTRAGNLMAATGAMGNYYHYHYFITVFVLISVRPPISAHPVR